MRIRTVDSTLGFLSPFPRQGRRRSSWAHVSQTPVPKLEHRLCPCRALPPPVHRPFLVEAHLSADSLHMGVRSQALDSQLEHVTPAATPAPGHWPGRLDLSWHIEEPGLCV